VYAALVQLLVDEFSVRLRRLRTTTVVTVHLCAEVSVA